MSESDKSKIGVHEDNYSQNYADFLVVGLV